MDDVLRDLERRATQGDAIARQRLEQERRRVGLGRCAILGDIHGNLAALEAVLRDVEALGIPDVACVGDIVGYGPEPAACVDLVRGRATFGTMGCHEDAIFHADHDFNTTIRAAIAWTRSVLDPKQLDYLYRLPQRATRGPDLFVHATPREPFRDAALMKGRGSEATLEDMFRAFDRFLFVGHMHLPVLFTPKRPGLPEPDMDFTGRYGCWDPAALGGSFILPPGEKAIVDVGSVGQPRDRDPRACYVVLEGETVTWRRVPYDVERTVARYAQTPLSPRFAERLRQGI